MALTLLPIIFGVGMGQLPVAAADQVCKVCEVPKSLDIFQSETEQRQLLKHEDFP